MNQPKSGTKSTLIFVGIAVIGLLIYFYNLGNTTDSSLNSLETQGSPESVEALNDGARVLSLLNQVSSLQIDGSVFETAAFRSLFDYSIEIEPRSVGRPNPFAPISQ